MTASWWLAMMAVGALTSARLDYHAADGARILAMMPIAAKSHWNVVDSVLQTLVARGHHVTAITPFPKKSPVANYTELDMSRLMPSGVSVPWDTVLGECSVHNNLPFLSGRHKDMCRAVYEHDDFWRIIETNKYDLFITELLASSCDAYVSYYLQIPQIVIVSSHVHTWYHHTLGSHMNPAHISTYHAPFAVPKNFMERMVNTYDYLYSHMVFKWVDRESTVIGRKYFGSDAPDADTLIKNTSLVFINGHYTVDLAKPLLPNFVNIGGIHLVQPKKLPKTYEDANTDSPSYKCITWEIYSQQITVNSDIEQYINDSPNGVIFFTLGSVIRLETAPAYLQKAFVGALAEIPQRVLWKYDVPDIEDLPKNVKIGKWFPQRDILEHKNVKLFISHGGMSGIYEAIDSGIPVLGIPLFFDQSHNIANIAHWGAGIMLDHKTLTKDIFVNAIKEMITNYDKYKFKAMELSRRFKDRQHTPKEEVIYWTEYVIKHKGAHHLKTAALKLSWYQYFLIDILITIVLIALVSLSVIFLLLKVIKNRIRNLSKTKKE